MKGLVLLFGLGSFFGALMLMYVGGSYFADHRTENIAGPGVDVFVLNKYPGKNGSLPIEISVRGGSKAGLNSVIVQSDDKIVSEIHGEGVTWGRRISSGKSRGKEDVEILLPVNDILKNERIVFDLNVSYVCALSSGSSSFSNENLQSVIHIDLPVFTENAKTTGQLLDSGLALIYFLVWLIIWYLIIKKLNKGFETNTDFEKTLGYSLLGFVAFGGMLGYWFFARFLGAVFGMTETWTCIVLVLIWLSAPVIAWRIVVKQDKRDFLNKHHEI